MTTSWSHATEHAVGAFSRVAVAEVDETPEGENAWWARRRVDEEEAGSGSGEAGSGSGEAGSGSGEAGSGSGETPPLSPPSPPPPSPPPPPATNSCHKAYGATRCAAGTALTEAECKVYGNSHCAGGNIRPPACVTSSIGYVQTMSSSTYNYPQGCFEFSNSQLYFNPTNHAGGGAGAAICWSGC